MNGATEFLPVILCAAQRLHGALQTQDLGRVKRFRVCVAPQGCCTAHGMTGMDAGFMMMIT